MFDLSPEKIFLVGIIAVVVLGPHRLPQAARSFGKAMAQLRRMSSSFQAEVRDAIAEPSDALNAVVGDLRPSQIRRSVRQAVTSTVAPITDPLRSATQPSQTPQPAQAPQTAPAPPGPSGGMGAAPDDPSLN